MTMPIPRIPSWSRRRVLKAGALPFLGLDLPRLLAAEATPSGPGPAPPGEVVHLHLPVRRPQPARLVGPEARRAGGDPRAVPAHRHGGPRLPRRRADAAPGAAGGSLLRHPLDEPQRPGPRRRQPDAPGGPVAAGHERPVVRRDRREAAAVARRACRRTSGCRSSAAGRCRPDPTYLTGGFLGMAHAPLLIGDEHDDNPANPDFRVDAFDTARRAHPRPRPGPDATARDRSRPAATRRPPPARSPGSASGPSTCSTGRRPAGPSTSTAKTRRVRDRYGRHPLGQNLLLARRLIEAGVRLVNVVGWCGLAPGDKFLSVETWDMHGNGGIDIFGNGWNGLGWALPCCDQAVSALLEDLDARGLLDEHAGGAGRRVRPHAADQPGRPRPSAATTGRTATRPCSPAPGSAAAGLRPLGQAGRLREGPPRLPRGLRGDPVPRPRHPPRDAVHPTASPSAPARARRSSTFFDVTET